MDGLSTPSAPSHPAPPADTRPRSGLAIAALVVSLVLSLVALAAGAWVALAPAVLLAAWALFSIRPERLRGQGMAIAALVVALAGGACSYMGAALLRDAARHLATSAMAALKEAPPAQGAPDAADTLARWMTEAARADGAPDLVRERFRRAEEALGPATEDVGVGAFVLGARPVLFAPSEVEEIAPDVGPRWNSPAATLWATVRFRDGPVHLALVCGSGAAMDLQEAVLAAQSRRPTGVLGDVRFFRPRRR
jgi:hypothetical protein